MGRHPQDAESKLVTTMVKTTRAGAPPEKPRVKRILGLLASHYPEPKCALRYSSPLELLVAAVLSAQCTDARVNEVTADLFRRYRSASDYVVAAPAQLESDIRSTGFYRNKAKAIRAFCRALVEHHHGEVPRTLEELVQLPGVGRKTANLVLAEAFGIPGIVVDTHVNRLSQRLGLTQKREPEKIEKDLMAIVPRDQWDGFSLRLIQHGRLVCKARRPLCHQCFLLKNCPTGLSRI